LKRTKGPSAISTGAAAEELALQYLTAHGLKLVERNFRTPRGEIDIIMMDIDHLVFIEVRFRRSSKFGSAEETVNHQKQKKLLLAAQSYLQQKGLTERYACRFDVLAVSNSGLTAATTPARKAPETTFNWHKDAFSAY